MKVENSAASIKDKQIFDIGCLKEFKIKLINNGGMADIVDFDEFRKIKHNIQYSVLKYNTECST